ncbi:MAG: oligosaccharide flippase family protein [Deltaproteobacteria bacterium]|nr:oligosaccharide flippase family protein [Deltaproteobacteria bacterium]
MKIGLRPLGRFLKASLEKLNSGESLFTRATRGGLWLGAGSGVEQLMRLARNMIIARVIAPEAFGVMAIVLAACSALEAFTDIGVKSAVVQNPDGHEETFLNAAWWLSFARSVFLYAIAYAAAPWIAVFYSMPSLTPLLRVAFLSILFNGAQSAGLYVAFKDMDFKPWVAINLGSAGAGIFSTVLLVFFVPGEWALVAGYTIEAAVRCALSFALCFCLPGLKFERRHMESLWRFARGVFGLPILTNIFLQIDIFTIGKLCTPTELGLYSIAAAFSRIPFQMVGTLVGQVAMPVFSEMQEERKRSNTLILRLTAAISFLGFPMLLYVVLYSRELLTVLYGAPYAAAAVPFAILMATSFLRIVNVPIVTYYFAIGKPETHRLATALRTAMIVVIIYPAVRYFGIEGGAAASLASMLLGHVVQVFQIRETSDLGLLEYVMIFLKPSVISLLVAGVWAATYGIFGSLPVIHMTIGALACLVSYAIAGAFILKYRKDSLLSRLIAQSRHDGMS